MLNLFVFPANHRITAMNVILYKNIFAGANLKLGGANTP